MFLRTLLAGLMLSACVAAPAAAQSREARHVRDDAGLFTKEAIRKADQDIALIKDMYKKDLLIETKVQGPDKNQREWAIEQAKNARVDGVYIVITTKPRHFEILVGNNTRKAGQFTDKNIAELKAILMENLKADKPDDALTKGVTYVRDHFHHATQTPVAPKRGQQQPVGVGGALPEGLGGFSWTGLICVGLVGLLAVWAIFGLIRGLSGGGAPGAGAYGGGPGFGAPAGGGFMSNLLGGMFGAAAGMWMYDQFFGGRHNSAFGAGDPGGLSSLPPTTPDTDYTGGGGDWGDAGGGGGDFGGGGGDWGGGGGDFGGGDFGGGGGDFGGGGGGDW